MPDTIDGFADIKKTILNFNKVKSSSVRYRSGSGFVGAILEVIEGSEKERERERRVVGK